MTHEQAIKICRDEVDFYGAGVNKDELETIVIKALQKQVPKPIKMTDPDGCLVCQDCGGWVTSFDEYCSHCGQKLDGGESK